MTSNRHAMPVAAHLLLRDDAHRYLFMRRANTGYADGQWSVPAGHVEQGETLVQACRRETIEEIDVELAVTAFTPLLVQHKHDTDGEERIDAFFFAELPTGYAPRIAEPHSCDKLAWHKIDRPPTPLIPYVANALDVIVTGSGPVSYFGFD